LRALWGRDFSDSERESLEDDTSPSQPSPPLNDGMAATRVEFWTGQERFGKVNGLDWLAIVMTSTGSLATLA
jgi:hypothetical protein